MSETDVLKMKVADLKRELKLRGLPTTGNKTELQERLQSALLDGDLSLEDATISEDILDEVLTDEEEKAVLESPKSEIVSLPGENLSEKNREMSENSALDPLKSTSSSLKRKPIQAVSTIPLSTGNSVASKDNSIPAEKQMKLDTINENKIIGKSTEISSNSVSGSDDNKKVIKLSELSMKERLELRAKKFGSSNNTTGSPASGGGEEKEHQQIQALKKRAERFGCVLSSKIAEIEKQEKLQKRRERFGSGVNNNHDEENNGSSNTSSIKISTNATNNSKKEQSDVYAEKARLRLERFKTK